MWLRVVAGSIVALGLAVSVLLPNGYACPDDEQVGRQWSYFQERWSYGCRPSAEEIESQIMPYHPMGADIDRRIPLRIGAVLAGLVIAWGVIWMVNRRDLRDAGVLASWSHDRWAWILVVLSAISGATIALLLTLRQDPYCILHGRGPGSLSCSYRSFFGSDTEPGVVEALFGVVGAVAGTGLGLLIARLLRHRGTSRTIADDLASA
jgi:hypothetical protein